MEDVPVFITQSLLLFLPKPEPYWLSGFDFQRPRPVVARLTRAIGPLHPATVTCRAFAKGMGSCLTVGSAYHKGTNAKVEWADGVLSDTLRAKPRL